MSNGARVVAGKIERIELFHVEIPLPTPLFPVWIPGYPQYARCYTLLVVTTRDGLTGYATGPAFKKERSGLGEYIGQFLLGLDPYDVDLVRERLRQASYLGWRNNWMDVAFWDLAAKAKGVPLHQFMVEKLEGDLGSAAPESLPAYASFLELRPPRVRAEALERAARNGFKAAKVCVHSIQESDDLDQIRLARDVLGPRFELMVHAHQAWSVSLVEDVPRWDLERARRFIEVATDLKYAWVQEPLHDEAWEELSQLTAESSIAIAGGDLTFTYVPIKALIRDRSYSVLTPDSAFAGLGTVLRTLKACLDHGIDFSPACNGDGIGLMANLHALAAYARLRGSADGLKLEFPWEPPAVIPEHRDTLLKEPVHIRADGSVPVPTAPGLGLELEPSALRRYAERFYQVTPVRFVVSTARRSGLRQTAELAQNKRKRERSAIRSGG